MNHREATLKHLEEIRTWEDCKLEDCLILSPEQSVSLTLDMAAGAQLYRRAVQRRTAEERKEYWLKDGRMERKVYEK